MAQARSTAPTAEVTSADVFLAFIEAVSDLWIKGLARGAVKVRLHPKMATVARQSAKWTRHASIGPAGSVGIMYNATWWADDQVAVDLVIVECDGDRATASVAQGKVKK